MRFVRPLLGGLLLMCGLGCHSAFIEATVVNGTDRPLLLVEVDYPTASFGTENLAPGAQFHYRFKALGDGGTKVLWTDASHVDHTLAGPELLDGDEGRVTITFSAAGPGWATSLKNHGKPR